MRASPVGISWLNHTVCRPLSQLSSDSESQRIWAITSASRDGGSPSPSGRSGRSSLTMAARARRSRSLALNGVLIAGPFPSLRVLRLSVVKLFGPTDRREFRPRRGGLAV
jgi:hypothetical protein